MLKVDVPQVLISSAAIFGIGIVWYDFNKKVNERVSHLIKIMWCETAEEENERIMKEARRRIEKEERRIQEEMKRLEEKKRIEEEE